MKATELRIGNLVLYEGWEIILSVSDLVVIDLANKQGYEHKYKPIPLTEEGLLKFGFEKHPKEDDWLKFSFGGNILTRLNDSPFYALINIYGGKVTVIQYVHQLQNLYFALTNTELEIKWKIILHVGVIEKVV